MVALVRYGPLCINMDKKTITIGTLAILTISILGGIILTDDNVYYCEDRSIVMQCEKLTKYYSLDNGKCWNQDIGNKLCRTGWLKVEDDVIGETNRDNEGIEIEYNGRKWQCESNEPNSICTRDGTHEALYNQLMR